MNTHKSSFTFVVDRHVWGANTFGDHHEPWSRWPYEVSNNQRRFWIVDVKVIEICKIAKVAAFQNIFLFYGECISLWAQLQSDKDVKLMKSHSAMINRTTNILNYLPSICIFSNLQQFIHKSFKPVENHLYSKTLPCLRHVTCNVQYLDLLITNYSASVI